MNTTGLNILGLSAYYHDSAACLVSDGQIVAAAQQERFSRIKHDAGFPVDAIRYCLNSKGIELSDLDRVIFYESPMRKFGRLMATYLSFAPFGASSFTQAMTAWLPRKLFLRVELRRELRRLANSGAPQPPLVFGNHHRSHAASAFYPSPFNRAAILCLDGVGEWETTTAWLGDGNRIIPLWAIDFPHSLGLFYSAFTQYLGFKVNSGEYKLMGLAPYGRPIFSDMICKTLIDLKPDGSFRLNLDYFEYPTGFRMVSRRFEELFGGPCREPEGPLTQKHMDLARSVQAVIEEVILRLAATIKRDTGAENLCLAGGVALNCVANGRLLREGPFKDLWIQPASGDAGGALGAALSAWHGDLGHPRSGDSYDRMSGSFLGPDYSTEFVCLELDKMGAQYKILEDSELFDRVAGLLASGNIVGWVAGRMEFGPRALGARSILGDPRNPKMQSIMNLKIKFRESFRPFAPAVLAESVGEYFEMDRPSPYMLLVAPVHPKLRIPDITEDLFGIARLNVPRSTIPAVTHVDYSSRVQTVHRETNQRFHALLTRFRDITGCPMLINTSFNVRGEPIVCTPRDAYRCFMRSGIDYLVIQNCLMDKRNQLPTPEDQSWQVQYALD